MAPLVSFLNFFCLFDSEQVRGFCPLLTYLIIIIIIITAIIIMSITVPVKVIVDNFGRLGLLAFF